MSKNSFSGSLSHVERELRSLASGDILCQDLATLSNTAVVRAYLTLNTLQKSVEKRLTELKSYLHSSVQSLGRPGTSGGTELDVDGDRVFRDRRVSSLPDEDKLRALLESKGLKVTDAFDSVTSLKLNPSRIEYLINVGKLKREEVDSLRGETFAIRGEAGSGLGELLEGLLSSSASKSSKR